MNPVNLPGLRAEALQRLKRDGFVPFPDVEAAYTGFVWNKALRHDGNPRDHPLLNATDFEIEVLGAGKWEWVYAWLSPYHMASEYPDVIADLALVLLGHKPIEAETEQRLRQQLNR